MSRGAFLVLLGVLLFGAAAFAQDAGAASGSGTQSLVTLVVMLVVFAGVFYFMLIRPQRKRQQQHNQLLSALKKGDQVITAGGMYGEIDSIGDTSVVLTLEDGGKVRLARSSIIEKRVK